MKVPNVVDSKPRIVGGTAISIQKVPYQVSLRHRGNHICGGVILSASWVLTAAHCVNQSIHNMEVRAGSSKSNCGGSLHKVDKIYVHEDYHVDDSHISVNDIALLLISDKFKFDETRRPIKIFSKNEKAKEGARGRTSGWGRTSFNGSISTMLQIVTVPIISKVNCSRIYEQIGKLPPGQICAGFKTGGGDSCSGDSGGPLAIGGRLAGIVSWGIECGSDEYPGVYTEVAAYHDWIMKHIESLSENQTTSIQLSTTNPPSNMRMANEKRIYNARIVGGMPIDIQERPYQVVLLWRTRPFCGGVLISRRWILTAAHCITVPDTEIMIRAGSRISTHGGTVRRIAKAFVHPKYYVSSKRVPINDIALMFIRKPFDMNRSIWPIRLFDNRDSLNVGAFGKVSGWGLMEEEGKMSSYLLMTTAPIMSRSYCNKTYDIFGGLMEGQFCAGYKGGACDACSGDSGGPLTIDGKLAGLVSGGFGCARPRYPGIYTEIAVYREWIRRYTGV
ncbi:transmembrane protease serine 9 [Cephus cinctus]|uniref:Transmembrane protease serine 9 n=1 Tax=Cephus cinctus TaxID=211228 RepID=A0AAJ7FUP4_CEPCN|nr:transmembrane protease serine 9 [Cephus cinctus]